MDVAIHMGEALLYDGCVISPKNYRRLERPPMSCHICGISAWCTELTMLDSGAKHICEHCLNEGMPKADFATCGTKRCLLVQCMHHPHHGFGANGLRQAMRAHGQLRAAADGKTTTRVLTEQKELKLIGS